MEKGQVKWRNVLVNRPFLQRAKQSERLIAMPRRRVRAAKEREIEGLAAARDLHRFFQTRDRILVPSHQLIGQSDRPERIRSVRTDVESAAQSSDRTLKLLLNEEVPGDIRLGIGGERLELHGALRQIEPLRVSSCELEHQAEPRVGCRRTGSELDRSPQLRLFS